MDKAKHAVAVEARLAVRRAMEDPFTSARVRMRTQSGITAVEFLEVSELETQMRVRCQDGTRYFTLKLSEQV